jgi:hypothetical protein
VGGRAPSASGLLRAFVLAAALCVLLVLPGSASAKVWTDQPSYGPGSTVTISGDNSDEAGYVAGKKVNVAVSEPGESVASCTATADSSGAWSCQITLASDTSAIGSYSYTATGQTSHVSQSGSFADSGCPNSNALESHENQDPKLSASYTTSGGKATYSFKSSNESPVGGIPGLIEYCVYTSPQPDEWEALYMPVSGAWATGSGSGFFDFERPNGNPTNAPLDGTTQTMGDATWNSGKVPGIQTILLHINDTGECSALEGKTTETCFVRPCVFVKGRAHIGPKIGGELFDNRLCTTNPPGFVQEFRFLWEDNTKVVGLNHLNSASAVINNTEKKFSGQGTATVSKEKGYEISFSITVKGGKVYFVLVVEKAHVVVWTFIHEPMATGTEVFY